jgi:hypothetical protein
MQKMQCLILLSGISQRVNVEVFPSLQPPQKIVFSFQFLVADRDRPTKNYFLFVEITIDQKRRTEILLIIRSICNYTILISRYASQT